MYLAPMSAQFLIAAAHSGAGKILAECGGMMFLGRSITDANGQPWPMVDLLDIATTMSPKKLTLGYRTAAIEGHPLKGHEFHYSQYVGTPPAALYHWLG